VTTLLMMLILMLMPPDGAREARLPVTELEGQSSVWGKSCKHAQTSIGQEVSRQGARPFPTGEVVVIGWDGE
jgi:hypothetical protein